MNSTLSNSQSAENAFVPMTEAQMDSVRGGTDWPDWLVDLVEDVVTNVSDALEHLAGTFDPPPADPDEGFWDDVETELQDEGFIIPGGGL